MPTINISGLRNTRQLKLWLKAGKTVELCERGKILGRIKPIQTTALPTKQLPDFAARRRKIFGDRVLSSVDEFLKDRHRDDLLLAGGVKFSSTKK